jgi:hypothetical protein
MHDQEGERPRQPILKPEYAKAGSNVSVNWMGHSESRSSSARNPQPLAGSDRSQLSNRGSRRSDIRKPIPLRQDDQAPSVVPCSPRHEERSECGLLGIWDNDARAMKFGRVQEVLCIFQLPVTADS